MRDIEETLHLDNQICFPLYAVSRLTTQLYTPLLEKLDLTYPQYLVMLVLWQYKIQTVNEICSKLFLETNTVTPLLKRLEQKKMINRRRSECDERLVVVTLSEQGERMRESALCIPGKIVSQFGDDTLTVAEVENLKVTLNKLLDIIRNKNNERV